MRQKELGSMALPGVAILLATLALLGLFVEHAVASVAEGRLDTRVDAASECVASSSFSIVAKCADEPGKETAQALCRALRSQGYEGRIVVWYWECPRAPSGAVASVWAVQAASEVATPMSALSGVPKMRIGAHSCDWRLLWSSEGEVWRPADAGLGAYVLDAGEDAAAGDFPLAYTRAASEDDLPRAMRDVVTVAREAAWKCGSD